MRAIATGSGLSDANACNHVVVDGFGAAARLLHATLWSNGEHEEEVATLHGAHLLPTCQRSTPESEQR